METTAARRTPLRIPSSSTPAKAAHGDGEFHPAQRPHPAQLGHVDQARDGDEHDRGQDDLGEVAQEIREEQQAGRDGDRREHQRERRPGARLVVDGGLREASRHRDSRGRSATAQLAAARASSSWRGSISSPCFCGQGAGRRHALDVGEQEAGEGEGDDPVDIPRPQTGKREMRQAGGQHADRLEAELPASGVTDSATIEAMTTPSATGRAGKSLSPTTSSAMAVTPEGQDHRLGVGQLAAEDPHALEEVIATARARRTASAAASWRWSARPRP